MITACLDPLPPSAQPTPEFSTAMPRYSDNGCSSMLTPATSSHGLARSLTPTALIDSNDSTRLDSIDDGAMHATDIVGYIDDKNPAFSWAFSTRLPSFPSTSLDSDIALPSLAGSDSDPPQASLPRDTFGSEVSKVSSWLEHNGVAAQPAAVSIVSKPAHASATTSLPCRRSSSSSSSSSSKKQKRSQDRMESRLAEGFARSSGPSASKNAFSRPRSPRVRPAANPGVGRSSRGSVLRASSSSGGADRKALHRVRSRSHDGHRQGVAGQYGPHGSSISPDVPANMPMGHQRHFDFDPMVDVDDEDNCSSGSGAAASLRLADPPAAATQEAFRAHVQNLNPRLEQAMVDRVTVEQLKRYKRLVDFRAKHDAAVARRQCPSGNRCSVLGKGPNYNLSPSKGSEAPAALFHIVRSDDATSLEVGDEKSSSIPATFPEGIPIPPISHLPAEFECPLCFQVKRFAKPSDWTKHVHEDVQPFTCTFSKCGEPKSFKRKADWVRHESERHRHLESWRCDVPECWHVCYRKDNFVQHLVREHRLPEPRGKGSKGVGRGVQGGEDDKVGKLVEKCRVESSKQSIEEPCRFCGVLCNSWKKLTVHLAKHMEQISMPVLELIGHRLPRFEGAGAASHGACQGVSASDPATGSPMVGEDPNGAAKSLGHRMGPAISVTNTAGNARLGSAPSSAFFQRRTGSLAPDDMSVGHGFDGTSSLLSSSAASSPYAAMQGEGFAAAAAGTPFSGSLHSNDMRRFSSSRESDNAAMAESMLMDLSGMEDVHGGGSMRTLYQQTNAHGSWQQQHQQQQQAVLSQSPADMVMSGYTPSSGFQQPNGEFDFGVGSNANSYAQGMMQMPRTPTESIWMEPAWSSRLYEGSSSDAQQRQDMPGGGAGGSGGGSSSSGPCQWGNYSFGGY